MNKLISKILLFITILLIIIFFFEIVFRLTEKIPEYDKHILYNVDFADESNGNVHIHRNSKIPGLSYELIPNLEAFWAGSHISINSFGFRGKEYDKKKPLNTIRIINLGDSVTFGMQIKQNETFSFLMEKALNSISEKNIEVFNGGVCAYNSLQEFIAFKYKYLNYDPDIVILNFVENDYSEIQPLRKFKNHNDTTIYYKSNLTNKEILALNLQFFSPLDPKINRKLLEKSSFFRFLNIKMYNIFTKIDPYNYPKNAYLYLNGIDSDKSNKNAILDLINLTKSKNIKLLIVAFPYLSNERENDLWIRKIPKEEYGISLIDLNLGFSKYNFSDIRISPDSDDVIHINTLGNKIVSEEIVSFLLKNNWIS